MRREPWAAFPSEDTTVAQLGHVVQILGLEVQVRNDGTVFLVQSALDPMDPPPAEVVAHLLYGDDHELIVTEDTGTFEAFDQEARDRHAEGV